MSKNNPGKWDPPPKPEEAGLVDSALARIAQGVPNAAYSIAANTAQAAGVEYGTSDIVNAAPAPIHAPGGALSNQKQANFDSIKDDYQYKIASALYKSGQPDGVLEFDGEIVAELYSEDLSILFIKSGRTYDHVDIDTYRSYTGLSTAWNDLMTQAGY